MNKIDAQILTYESQKTGNPVHEVNEHPWLIRFTHWLNTISLFILIGSGLRIFLAFPSFGSKVPQENFFLEIPSSLTIGGWLGGALQWHLTFMWIYMATGVIYLGYQLASGHYKRVLFTHRDIPGVWPMIRHYFLFRAKPALNEQYNPLQKQAYTSVILLGVLSVLTGLVLYNPVQFSFLTTIMGGYSLARLWHFIVMCAFILFIIGHLIMVVLHGWNNFVSMLTGWKRNPEYLLEYSFAPAGLSQPTEDLNREETMDDEKGEMKNKDEGLTELETRNKEIIEDKKEKTEIKDEDKADMSEETK